MPEPRVLIANRGEIAVRIIRTCRELGLPSVAVYSDADRNSLHVDMADRAYRIGPPLPTDSYLSIRAILDAARRSRATLIHPGYGFLAESAEFARAVAGDGFIFVGPGPEALETMGDKVAARRAADRVGVPIVPGTPEPVGLDQAMAAAPRIGYPLAVKASFGGGGKGMRVVGSGEELEDALLRTAREAGAYFGRPEVYLERYIERAHHVEAQVMADAHGGLSFLGERDCSLQRRYQKLVEESPSPVVDTDLRARIGEAALAIAKEAGYLSAGTVEFIVDEDGSFYFLEMNTRLQVEHPVTEMVTGLDLVALQLQVAQGERVELHPDPRGHAIECRLNAEDPYQDFLPGPGRIDLFREPGGPFVRVDTGFVQGKVIPRDYDSMFAKLIVWGQDREHARRRMLRALEEFRIGGIPTTIPFHRWVLSTPEFREGRHTARFVEQALAQAELPRFEDPAPDSGEIASDGQARPTSMVVEVDGRRVPVRIMDERLRIAPSSPAKAGRHASSQHIGDVVAAPMQGTILEVLVERGQSITAGEAICILEAMKMENQVAAPRDGVVSELPIAAGQVVEIGQTIAVID